MTSPIPCLLFCPSCGLQHVDRDEWATRPHKSHLCHQCGTVWRVSSFPTVGVVSVEKGEHDNFKPLLNSLTEQVEAARANPIQGHHLAAVRRAIESLEAAAQRLMKQHNYDCGFFEGDAESLKSLLAMLRGCDQQGPVGQPVKIFTHVLVGKNIEEVILKDPKFKQAFERALKGEAGGDGNGQPD